MQNAEKCPLAGAALAETLLRADVFEVNRIQKKLAQASKPKGKGAPVMGEYNLQSGKGLKGRRKPVFATPYGPGVLFRAHGRDGLECRWEMPIEMATPSEVWGFADELVPHLGALPEGALLRVEEDKKGHMLILPSGQAVPVVPQACDEPFSATPPVGVTAIRFGDEHRRAILTCLKMASDDPQRDSLRGVWVDPEANVCFGTDGTRLVGRRFAGAAGVVPIFVPESLARLLVVPGFDPVWLMSWWETPDQRLTTLSGHNFHFAVRAAHEMPAYGGVTRTEGKTVLQLAAEPILTEMARWKKPRPRNVLLEVRPDGAVVLHLYIDHDCAGRIGLESCLLQAPPAEPVLAAFDPALLLEHVQAGGESSLSLAITRTEKGSNSMLIGGEPGADWVVTMGLRDPAIPPIWSGGAAPATAEPSQVDEPADAPEIEGDEDEPEHEPEDERQVGFALPDDENAQ